jgi:hypothetical protein
VGPRTAANFLNQIKDDRLYPLWNLFVTTGMRRGEVAVLHLVTLDMDNLPPTLTTRGAAELFGISYWLLRQEVERGTCPVTPLRFGHRVRWPTAAVLQALGQATQASAS